MEAEVLFDKLSHMEADEIADFCREREIRGLTAENHSCALARLFVQETTSPYVSVGSQIINWTGDPGQHMELSATMAEFVEKFDHFVYPDLVEEHDKRRPSSRIGLPDA